MSDLILHHFDPSPFAERVRLALGLKNLDWMSVQIPMIMPKPDLTALTGGYRKTPVLQIGADVYCDTRRIALELEKRQPSPPLFPEGTTGLALALARWSDEFLFPPGAALSMSTNTDLPQPVLKDRLAFFDFLDEQDLQAPTDRFYAQFTAGLQQLEQMLGDGRPWLLGDDVSWADLACYNPVWMCQGNIRGADELLTPLPGVRAWAARVAELGHGHRHEMDADDALAQARAGEADPAPGVMPHAWPRLAQGDRVSVAAEDYGRDPVHGALLALSLDGISISRDDPRAGAVVVHFPRLGFRVTAEGSGDD